MQKRSVSKVCFVADGVESILVGVMEAVTVMVGEDVAVGGSGEAEAVGDDSSVGVRVTVGVEGGLFFGMKIIASRRINPIAAGIPYLR